MQQMSLAGEILSSGERELVEAWETPKCGG